MGKSAPTGKFWTPVGMLQRNTSWSGGFHSHPLGLISLLPLAAAAGMSPQQEAPAKVACTSDCHKWRSRTSEGKSSSYCFCLTRKDQSPGELRALPVNNCPRNLPCKLTHTHTHTRGHMGGREGKKRPDAAPSPSNQDRSACEDTSPS